MVLVERLEEPGRGIEVLVGMLAGYDDEVLAKTEQTGVGDVLAGFGGKLAEASG